MTPLFLFALVLLVMQSFFRLLHVAVHWQDVTSLWEVWQIVVHGLRFDFVITAYCLSVPVLAFMLTPPKREKAFQRILLWWSSFCIAVLLFLEVAAFPFFAEYGVRPNRLMFEYLVNWREVGATVLKTQWYLFILVAALIYGAVKLNARILLSQRVRLHKTLSLRNANVSLLSMALIVVFCRGGVPWGNPINVSSAVFGSNEVANQIALNSVYTLGNALVALRFEDDPTAEYHVTMPEAHVYEMAKAASQVDPEAFTGGPENPLLHVVKPRAAREKPRNLVIILEESMGAEYVGILGGLPLTPNFDRLSKEGVLLEKLYATGTRSARGIEAVIAGFLPTPGKAVIKLGLAQNNFFTVGQLLKNAGYETSFIYGGDSSFDNMRTFSSNNGFETIIDERNYDKPNFKGIWGVSDEDLFTKANDWFVSQGDRPFFSLVFSSSNHGPFEFPDGKIELYEEPKGTVHNTIKYADFAIGKFFEAAKKESYYSNTVFLVVADHNWRNFGSDLVPIKKMQIPGLIIAKDLKPDIYKKPMSQVDLMPSVLPMLGKEFSHPMVGHDIFALPASYPGRAILQFDRNNAYMVGDRVIIHSPQSDPRQFSFDGEKLHKETLDPTLAEEATAHVLLPGMLYKKRNYHAAPTSLSRKVDREQGVPK